MKRAIILSVGLALITSCGTTRQQKTPGTTETPAARETVEAEPAMEEVKKETLTKKIQNSMLIGEIEKNDFLSAPFDSWFNRNYEEYIPSPEALIKIRENLPEVDLIRVYMGTWCPDSRREVPKFFKLLDQAEYDLAKVEMMGVDRSKSTPDKSHKELDIQRVPTFIFYKEGKEIGRFVERPRESLEVDIARIVAGEEYKHSYE